MKYECDVIRDLIPLYIDDVASKASRRMVEEHLAECADCRALLGRMKSEEVETAINFEKEDVIAGQRRFFKRRSAVIGSVIAGIFLFPVLICLIVNLASGSGLDWFFIVLASLLVAASLLVVPLMAPENKGLWTLGSFTVSLLLLFGVCCLYTGGNWFFVAGTAVLFGLSLVFLPFAVRSRLLADYLEDRKGLAVVTADTVLFALMMLAIGLHTGSAGFFRIAVPMTVLVILIVWALFFIIRNARQIKTKQEFLVRLEEELSDLPKEETQRQLTRYTAKIDQKMETGLTEREAVAEMESIAKITSRVHAENPNFRYSGKTEGPDRSLPAWEIVLLKTEGPDRSLPAWEIVLLALGAPIWITLLIVGFALLFTVYVVIWVAVISLWITMVSFMAGAVGSVVLSIWAFFQGNGLQGIVMLCAGSVLAGLSILLFFGCRAATKGAVILTKNIAVWVKSLFMRRG